MLQIKKLTFNMFSENTFVVWDEITKDCAVVDPGCFDEYEEKELSDFIEKNNFKVKYLINTHCHIDHIFGCEFIKEKFSPVYLAPEKDIPLLENVNVQSKKMGIEFSTSILPDKYITEQTVVELGESELKFLFTPGHTPGEYCIYFQDEKFCITGDVLFYDSIGRTDLWGGNYDDLIKSIREKLLTLPDETTIFPGHGQQSTILRERTENPFLN
ncbi:MAG: MBL fold metallo-hydrolase [Ignavibacteriaceae bacterium]